MDLSLDSMLVCKTPRPGQTQTGRKPVPFTEYHLTRKRKIENLQHLSNDKNLSVQERKRYRA